MNDNLLHKLECEAYKNCRDRHNLSETVLIRMMTRVITRLSLDGGEQDIDLCSNIPNSIRRRSCVDLLGHRDEISRSERHFKECLITKYQFELFFEN